MQLDCKSFITSPAHPMAAPSHGDDLFVRKQSGGRNGRFEGSSHDFAWWRVSGTEGLGRRPTDRTPKQLIAQLYKR